jgi:hypothetical protein
MWELDNRTPYAAERTWVRDKAGLHGWLVAVRATFDIMPEGYLIPAQAQPPPPRETVYRGDPASTSPVLDSDLLAQKPGTDIILDAIAYAPRERPTDKVEVSLHIGGLSKTLVVYGPRVYVSRPLGLATSSSQAFTTQPIKYEWAFGGADLKDPDVRKRRMDDRNPVGKGVAVDQRALQGQPAHVIDYRPGEGGGAPAGFGPIAMSWSPRRQRAGTYDTRWEQSKRPLLPDDYDPAFAFSAPDDQRFTTPLRGGDPVLITNMTPEGTLRFDLPRIGFRFKTVFPFRSVRHRGWLTTVFITPHARTVSMIWQSVLNVPALEGEYLDFTLIVEEPAR